MYGSATFETTPSDAGVYSNNGYELGTTPLTVSELQPGKWKFTVRREGYEPVLVVMDIVGNETNIFRTNLVSTTFVGAINAARRYLASKNYGQAYEAANEALRVQPGDTTATSLKREAVGQENLRLVRLLGDKGDYIGGIQKLQLVPEALPDNAEAKQLLADYKKCEPEQIEWQKLERLNRGTELVALLSTHSRIAPFNVLPLTFATTRR